MKAFIDISLVIGIAIVSLGCGRSTESTSQLFDAYDTPSRNLSHHLLVLNEGYGSCRGSSFPSGHMESTQINAIKTQLESRVGGQVQSISTCFGTGQFKFKVDASESGVMDRVSSFEEYWGSLKDRINRDPNMFIHLIGHSHGGWLAMQTMTQLNARPGHVSLDTLDPISFTDCRAPQIVAHIAGAILGNEGAPGCTQAPAESPEFVQALQTKAVSWVNLYQNQFRLLHSGPEHDAINYIVPFGYGPNRVKSHTDMASDPRVWAQIERHLVNARY